MGLKWCAAVVWLAALDSHPQHSSTRRRLTWRIAWRRSRSMWSTSCANRWAVQTASCLPACPLLVAGVQLQGGVCRQKGNSICILREAQKASTAYNAAEHHLCSSHASTSVCRLPCPFVASSLCCLQLDQLQAEKAKLHKEKVDLENQLEAEQVWLGAFGQAATGHVSCGQLAHSFAQATMVSVVPSPH